MHTTSEIVEQFNSTHATAQAIIEKTKLDSVVYPGDWTVRSVLINLFFWDKEAFKSLQAFRSGSGYAYPDFSEDKVDAINRRALIDYAHLSNSEVISEWHQAHEQLAALFLRFEDADMDSVMMCPWAAPATLCRFMEEMITHERDHFHDIARLSTRTSTIQ